MPVSLDELKNVQVSTLYYSNIPRKLKVLSGTLYLTANMAEARPISSRRPWNHEVTCATIRDRNKSSEEVIQPFLVYLKLYPPPAIRY